jgi:hypothetical protein
MTLNLQLMQWRVVELEQVCREMKDQMSRLVWHVLVSSAAVRGLKSCCQVCSYMLDSMN